MNEWTLNHTDKAVLEKMRISRLRAQFPQLCEAYINFVGSESMLMLHFPNIASAQEAQIEGAELAIAAYILCGALAIGITGRGITIATFSLENSKDRETNVDCGDIL